MYTKIDELIWKDSKLKKVSTESKLLFIYLLSCQHRNVLGLYSLPKCYVQGDLGYPLETVSKGLQELFDNGFITYDEESETVLINNFLKYNPLENGNQVTGALKVMPTIPKTQLFYKLIDVIKSSDNARIGELKIGIEDYLKSNRFERVTVTVTQTVSKQEEEEVKEEVTEKEKEVKPTRHKYGEYKKVLLTDIQLEKLKKEFSDWEERIQRLDDYIASKGDSYKDHLATIRNWAKKDKDKKAANKKQEPITNNPFLQRKLERMAAEKINE